MSSAGQELCHGRQEISRQTDRLRSSNGIVVTYAAPRLREEFMADALANTRVLVGVKVMLMSGRSTHQVSHIRARPSSAPEGYETFCDFCFGIVRIFKSDFQSFTCDRMALMNLKELYLASRSCWQEDNKLFENFKCGSSTASLWSKQNTNMMSPRNKLKGLTSMQATTQKNMGSILGR